MCVEKIWGATRMKSWNGVRTAAGKVYTRVVLILGQRVASMVARNQHVRAAVLSGG